MRGLRKSKRLSWAPDACLCQMRLFLSEDSPSQVGLGVQDHLQARSSKHPAGASDDALPPGFGGGHPLDEPKIKLSEIPVIKWRPPILFLLSLGWQVVSGEESQETEVQKKREMRMLEAFYPCASAIPPNPSATADKECTPSDDDEVPAIPITAIEDDDMMLDTPCDVKQQYMVPAGAQLSVTPAASDKPLALNSNPDLVVAALGAITESSEHRNIIDRDLLVKILSNPKLVENLISNHAQSSIDSPGVSNLGTSTSHPPPPVPLSEPKKQPPVCCVSSGPYYTAPNGNHVPPGFAFPSHNVGVPQAKDLNYYKNLIQQHGDDRSEPVPSQRFNIQYKHPVGVNQEHTKFQRPKQKIMKPCIYFNRAKGCRNGSNCMFQHDESSQQRSNSSTNNYSSNVPESQSTKRVKMDREISS